MSKSIQRSRDINTQGESAESSAKRMKAGTLQSMPTYEGEVQGLVKYALKRCIGEGM
jgi:hypothetical protein